MQDNWLKEMKEAPIKEFLKELNFSDIFAYDYNADYTIITIYTKYPGIWIGKAGKDVELFENILKKHWNHDVKAKYKEIKGNFITFNSKQEA